MRPARPVAGGSAQARENRDSERPYGNSFEDESRNNSRSPPVSHRSRSSRVKPSGQSSLPAQREVTGLSLKYTVSREPSRQVRKCAGWRRPVPLALRRDRDG